MAKNKKRRSAPSPDATLASLLREVDWLREARGDDAVSSEEWQRRGKAVLLRGSRLPAAHAAAFQQHYLAMQQLEMVEQLEGRLEASASPPALPSPVA